MANKHLKRCALVIRGMQTKTSMRYHSMPTRMAKTSETDHIECL